MKTKAPKPSAPIALALALSLALSLTGTGTAQAQACLDKRAIQEAVATGQIMSLDAVLASAESAVRLGLVTKPVKKA